MSASSLMYVLLHSDQIDFEKLITVINPGGMVRTMVHKRENGEYWMSLIGNATEVAKVNISQADAINGNFDNFTWNETGEQAAYEAFIAQLHR